MNRSYDIPDKVITGLFQKINRTLESSLKNIGQVTFEEDEVDQECPSCYFLAFDDVQKKKFLLRILKLPQENKGMIFKKRLEREYKLLKGLSHDCLQRIICKEEYMFTHNNYSAVLLKRWPMDLRQFKGPWIKTHIKCIIFQVLFGLHSLHSNKFLHRNITPESVKLNKKGQTFLGDFHIPQDMTAFGSLYESLDSVNWSLVENESPEYLLTGVKLPESDIYQVGLLFYRMLKTGLENKDKIAPLSIFYDSCSPRQRDQENARYEENCIKLLKFLGGWSKECQSLYLDFLENQSEHKRTKIKHELKLILLSIFPERNNENGPNKTNRFSASAFREECPPFIQKLQEAIPSKSVDHSFYNDCFDFLKKTMHPNPKKRSSAWELMSLPFFRKFNREFSSFAAARIQKDTLPERDFREETQYLGKRVWFSGEQRHPASIEPQKQPVVSSQQSQIESHGSSFDIYKNCIPNSKSPLSVQSFMQKGNRESSEYILKGANGSHHSSGSSGFSKRQFVEEITKKRKENEDEDDKEEDEESYDEDEDEENSGEEESESEDIERGTKLTQRKK